MQYFEQYNGLRELFVKHRCRVRTLTAAKGTQWWTENKSKASMHELNKSCRQWTKLNRFYILLLKCYRLVTCSSCWNSHRVLHTQTRRGLIWQGMLVRGKKEVAEGVLNTWGPLKPRQACPAPRSELGWAGSSANTSEALSEAWKTEGSLPSHGFHITLQDDTNEISATKYFCPTNTCQQVESNAALHPLSSGQK